MKKIAFALVMLSLIACGDDEPPAPLPINNPSDMGPDQDPNNQPDSPPDTDLPVVDPRDGCTQIEDLGVISGPNTIEKRLIEPVRGHESSCQTAEVSSGSKLFSFTVDGPTRLALNVDGLPKLVGEAILPPPPAVELRAGLCDPEKATVLSCDNDRGRVHDLSPNTVYFLVINGEFDSGGVRMNFTTRELACNDTDNKCLDGFMQRCVNGIRLDKYPCVSQTCDSEQECAANTCDNVVEFAASGTHRIVGSVAAYENSWNPKDYPSCTFTPGQNADDMRYADAVLKFPNVPANTTIFVSAENDESEGSYGFFFTSSCEATSCLHAGSFNINNDNETEFTTATAGDVFLRVESFIDAERTFVIDVTLE